MGALTRHPLRVLLWGLALLALGAVLWFQVIAPRMTRDLADTLGHGDYRLTATDGTPFTEDTLRGGPTAVFFGFTHCPEVCPTTLADISSWQEDLGDRADRLRIYFVTVDPERDTADVLGDYVGWVPHTLGVTGPPDEIEKAMKAFRIFARKVPLSDGSYTMDHSAFVLLFDDGRFFEPIAYQEDFSRALDKLNRLLG